MSFDPNRPAEPAAPATPATPADPAWPAAASAPTGATERVPFAPVAPEPTGVPTAPVAATGPVMTPGPAASSRKSGSGGRLLNIVLVVAAAVAIGGVAFAVGRNTAPVSASTGTGRGNGTFGGAFPGRSFTPGASGAPGFGRGGFGGALGGAGLTIQGTVESVDGDTMTIKTANGATIAVTTGSSTTYHTQTAASASDVQTGFHGPGPGRRDGRGRRRLPAGRQRRAVRVPSARPAASPSSPDRRARLTDMHLLVIEDDPRLVRLLRRLLEEDRHIVETATTGGDGLDIAEATSGIEVVILDLGLPDISGLEVARRIRATGSEVSILMLTARDTVGDRVTGLDAGADDYLVKPFAYEELAARLRALGRRGASARRPEPKLVVGPIVLDEMSRRVTLNGKTIDLSPREFSLLECLLRHPGQTLSRDQLLDQAWPFSVAVTPNAVDAYVHYLRDKLGAAGKLIETVRGVGYRLADA